MKIIGKIFNIFGFQVSWWICVLGVKYGWPYLGPTMMAIYLLIHLYYFRVNQSEIIFIILVGFIGTIVDTIFLQSSLIIYYGLTVSYIAPIWIIAMWLGFAATMNHSFSWVNGKWLIAFIIGAIFGPLSYIAGIKFDALFFQETIFSILILAIVWGLIVPLLFLLNNKIIQHK